MKKLVVLSLVLGLFANSALADWIMFTDKTDTYLYNNKTGEIYVRYRKGGKNYQDVFVKMSQGMSAMEIERQNQEALVPESKDELEEMKQKSLKQSQEMMNNVLEGEF